jgi:TrmH family RNA methyltransferase
MTTKLLTTARDLHRRKARERLGLVVAEGSRSVAELLRSRISVQGVLFTEEFATTSRGAELVAQVRGAGVPNQAVGRREFETASDTDSPQGILAIGVVPALSLNDLPAVDPMRLLVLDAVQDPGNVGTIVRTAAAFGVTATFALPGTVDLWNAKVVRSGMGAHFSHPCLSGTWDELDTFRRDRAISVWAADAGGESIRALDVPQRLAVVVGNEGAGVSALSRTRVDRLVALPISPTVESLNVAVAAGILLYELRQ